MRKVAMLFAVIAFVFILASCSVVPATTCTLTVTPTAPPTAAPEMTVSSPGIVNGYIDPEYGAHGRGLSIPLEIANAPKGTVCFALLMDDPDAVAVVGKRYLHWMAADFTQTSLPAGFSAQADSLAVQGKNDSGTVGYTSPNPPDKDHTYVITVYALDAKTGLQRGFTKDQFLAAINGHILAQAQVTGIYRK